MSWEFLYQSCWLLSALSGVLLIQSKYVSSVFCFVCQALLTEYDPDIARCGYQLYQIYVGFFQERAYSEDVSHLCAQEFDVSCQHVTNP